MVKDIKEATILNNGQSMPWLGFGVFKVEEGESVVNAVKHIMEKGVMLCRIFLGLI